MAGGDLASNENWIRWYPSAAEDGLWRAAISLGTMRGAEETATWHALTPCIEGCGCLEIVPREGCLSAVKRRNWLQLAAAPGGAVRVMTLGTWSRSLSMQASAAEAGICLSVRWAFRSADDQPRLIRKRLSYGARIDELLTWIAAPGCSEHHTGRALDFECLPATRPFEDTPAYDWLCRNAEEFEFRLSYPANNAHGLTYELALVLPEGRDIARRYLRIGFSYLFWAVISYNAQTLRYAERVAGR